MNARILITALALTLTGSAMADVYQEDFSTTILGTSLGLSATTDVGSGQCSELTCNGNYYNIATMASGWTLSPAVYAYAYNTPAPASIPTNLGIGGGPYNNIAILLNENGLGQIATMTNTISGLTAGKTYDLTFQYWGDNEPFVPAGTYSFDVNVNGTDTPFLTQQNIGLGSGNLHTADISFVASASPTSLIFTQDTIANGGTSASPIIDNIAISATPSNSISISATPEPGFYGLLALGLSGIGIVLSRRKKT